MDSGKPQRSRLDVPTFEPSNLRWSGTPTELLTNLNGRFARMVSNLGAQGEPMRFKPVQSLQLKRREFSNARKVERSLSKYCLLLRNSLLKSFPIEVGQSQLGGGVAPLPHQLSYYSTGHNNKFVSQLHNFKAISYLSKLSVGDSIRQGITKSQFYL